MNCLEAGGMLAWLEHTSEQRKRRPEMWAETKGVGGLYLVEVGRS